MEFSYLNTEKDAAPEEIHRGRLNVLIFCNRIDVLSRCILRTLFKKIKQNRHLPIGNKVNGNVGALVQS